MQWGPPQQIKLKEEFVVKEELWDPPQQIEPYVLFITFKKNYYSF